MLGTDHLNDVMTSTAGTMRQPEKLLRWLLEIAGAVRVRWAFANWASRNRAERDLELATTEGFSLSG